MSAHATATPYNDAMEAKAIRTAVPGDPIVHPFKAQIGHTLCAAGVLEMLAAADADEASFLLEASCFEHLTGALCDEVLERTGSAQLLESVRRRNLLVVPLDDRREWYRFHHLMTQFLQTELSRRDPARKRAIHRRASDWYQVRGDADGAIRHAVRSGDLDRAESLVIEWFGRFAVAGRNHTIDAWLELFTSEELDVGVAGFAVGFHEVEMAENLWSISIDPDESMREYVLLQLKVRAMRDMLFRSRIFTYLAAATPGLKELVTIGKIWELTQHDRKVKGGREYDLVIVDAPATAADRGAAERSRVRYVPTLDWMCTETCSPVVWNSLAFRDTNHLTDGFARVLGPRLDEVLDAAR